MIAIGGLYLSCREAADKVKEAAEAVIEAEGNLKKIDQAVASKAEETSDGIKGISVDALHKAKEMGNLAIEKAKETGADVKEIGTKGSDGAKEFETRAIKVVKATGE